MDVSEPLPVKTDNVMAFIAKFREQLQMLETMKGLFNDDSWSRRGSVQSKRGVIIEPERDGDVTSRRGAKKKKKRMSKVEK